MADFVFGFIFFYFYLFNQPWRAILFPFRRKINGDRTWWLVRFREACLGKKEVINNKKENKEKK